MEPAELFNKVKTLAKQGLTQKQIATELGFKTPFTLNSRLIKASQASGKPVPAFRQPRKNKPARRVETVLVKRLAGLIPNTQLLIPRRRQACSLVAAPRLGQ